MNTLVRNRVANLNGKPAEWPSQVVRACFVGILNFNSFKAMKKGIKLMSNAEVL